MIHEVKRFKDSLIKRALLLQPILQHLEVDGLCFPDDYAISRRLIVVSLVVKVDFNRLHFVIAVGGPVSGC